MIISAVLLPTESDSINLCEFSRELSKQTESLIQLDNKSVLPHVTIAQFEGSLELAKELWDQIGEARHTSISLTSAGLNFYPSFDHDQIWVELQFLKSEELSNLNALVANSEFAQSHHPLSGIGDRYRPHCTLGLSSGNSIPKIDLQKADIFKQQFLNMSLAVGINGENFTYTKTLYS